MFYVLAHLIYYSFLSYYVGKEWRMTRNFVPTIINEYRFPNLSKSKYYVVDLSFTNMHDYLATYRDKCYHLQNY